MADQPSYYSIIPAHVRYDDDLSPREIIMYSEISALCNANGYCHAGNSYFAKLYKVSNVSVSRWIKSLERKGYIKIEYQYNGSIVTKRFIKIDHAVNKNVNGTVNKNVNGTVIKNDKDNNTRDINNTRDNNRDNKKHLNSFTLFEKHFGILNAITVQKISDWIDQFNKNDEGDKIVTKAINVAIENKAKSFSYVETILKNWSKQEVSTEKEADEQTLAKTTSKKSKAQKNDDLFAEYEKKLTGGD